MGVTISFSLEWPIFYTLSGGTIAHTPSVRGRCVRCWRFGRRVRSLTMEQGEAPAVGGGEVGELPAAGEANARSNWKSSAVTPSSRARAGAYTGLLAGWAGGGVGSRAGGSAPAKSLSSSLGGYVANAGLSPHPGARDGPHSTGKVGRTHKRRKLDTSKTQRPCLFWRQGQCTKGDQCGYVHGDSKVLCTQFVSQARCRFGDKCAFRHDASKKVNGSNQNKATITPLSNPFATHAENCGCEVCHPSVYRAANRDDDGEDGEMMLEEEDVEDDDLDSKKMESEKQKKEARDSILSQCATIDSPEVSKLWSGFLDPEVRQAQRKGSAPAPYRK